MKKLSIFIISFFQSLSVVICTKLVVFLMEFINRNAVVDYSKWAKNLLDFVYIMLFIVYAVIINAIVFGYPVYLFLNKQFKEAIKAIVAVILWMILFFALSLFAILSISVK